MRVGPVRLIERVLNRNSFAAGRPSPRLLPEDLPSAGEPGGFDGIQGLRALAAVAVALLHVADEAGALVGMPGQAPYRLVDALPLEAGVDLFFVISGFVMVWSSWGSFGQVASVGPFVWRRLLRIVPLYWLLTAATVLVALAAPGLISDGAREGWGYVAASVVLLPWRRADGFVQPVLRLGWTLEYEMLFYAIVACALPLRRPLALAAILAGILALAIAGQSIPWNSAPPIFWTDPIVLEFGLGVVVAIAARYGQRGGWSGLAVLVAILLLLAVPGDHPRVVARGIPAALLVLCALSWRRLPGWLLLLGDASYALYLVHPFPMRAIRVAFGHMNVPAATAVPLYLVTTMAACLGLAVALHLLLEQPILRCGRSRLRRRADAASIRE